jgi:hypothetical protein
MLTGVGQTPRPLLGREAIPAAERGVEGSGSSAPFLRGRFEKSNVSGTSTRALDAVEEGSPRRGEPADAQRIEPGRHVGWTSHVMGPVPAFQARPQAGGVQAATCPQRRRTSDRADVTVVGDVGAGAEGAGRRSEWYRAACAHFTHLKVQQRGRTSARCTGAPPGRAAASGPRRTAQAAGATATGRGGGSTRRPQCR